MDVRGKSVGEEWLGGIDWGNAARNRRLVELADVLVARPSGTCPEKFQRPAQLKAFYRLMNHKTVTHEAIISAADVRTHERIKSTVGTVLMIHDWTEIDFTGHTTMVDVLGQIGNGGRRGYVCANALAVVAETREVLGLAAQILFHRPRVKKDETRAECRDRATRESRLWLLASQQIPAPEKGHVQVEIADRGADIIEYLDHVESHNKQYLVRSRHNRRVSEGGLDPDTGEPLNPDIIQLHDLAHSLECTTGRSHEIPARPGHARRTAQLSVGFSAVVLHVPAEPRGETRRVPLAAWVVIVKEVKPPSGVEPLEWVLLTNVPVVNSQDAWECVSWYEIRWGIEEYHKVLKTGCGIEQ